VTKLFVVPTPIGNLKDITLRALEILGEVTFIIAEDTRTSKVLLKHYGISKPLYSYHKHNEQYSASILAEKIAQTGPAAIISDAGTPGVSDAAYLLINTCIDMGIEVECLPGPTALIPALIQSGFPAHAFVFEGFIPHKKGRNTFWLRIAEESRTCICYESPHRIDLSAREMLTWLGPARKICMVREISKKFMETWRGTAQEFIEYSAAHKLRGEIVLVIHGKEK